MESVHVYISLGRFKSVSEMRVYIDKRYTENGDSIPSLFMIETGLSNYEPDCIETILSSSGKAVTVSELLDGASYYDQWLPQIDGQRIADAAICVFSPNVLATPAATSLEYLGKFDYVA